MDYNILGSILGYPILGNYHLGFKGSSELKRILVANNVL